MESDAKVLRDIRDLLTRIDRKLGPDGPGPYPITPQTPTWIPTEPIKPWWETVEWRRQGRVGR